MSNSNPYAAKTAEVTTVEPTVETPLENFEQTVPTGSAAKVLDWVDGSKIRALVALKTEKAGKNRKTLIDDLENLV